MSDDDGWIGADDIAALDRRAREILGENDRGGYTVPTAGLYPFQWNWDSAFAALGFATFDLPRAWTELETLLGGRWPNGMVPHIVFHRPDEGYFPGPDVWGTNRTPPTSGITQPPVAASAVRELLARDGPAGESRAAALYRPLLDWHRWFMRWRLEDGVLCITHPWESGRDNAPDWDAAMASVDGSAIAPYTRRDTGHVDPSMRPTEADYDRYVALVEFGREHAWDETVIRAEGPLRVADPTMTFVLLRAHRDLAAVGRVLGEDTAEIDSWIRTLEAGVPTLWNETTAAFDARDVRTGELAGSLSNASFLAWWGGVDEPRLLATLDRVLAATPHAVPSHPPWSARFDRTRYWRGPVWAVMNRLIATGLAEHGHRAQARAIRRSTRELIREHGFAEYFDPVDGTPAGGDAFTWTAAVWLEWASPTASSGERDSEPAREGR